MAHFNFSTTNTVKSTSLDDPTKAGATGLPASSTDLLRPIIGPVPRTGPVLTDPISGPPPSIIPTPAPILPPNLAPLPVEPPPGGGGPGSEEVIGWTPEGIPIIGYNPDGSPILGTPVPIDPGMGFFGPGVLPSPAPAPPRPPPPTVAPIGEDEGEEEAPELSPTEQAAQLLFGAVRNNPFITPEGRTNLEQGLAPLLNQINPAFWRYTSPTIIKSLESLFRSLGLLTEDLRFTVGSRRPTALR